MLVIARHLVRTLVLLTPFFLKDPVVTILSIHALSVLFSTLLQPNKSDLPTRILTSKENVTTVLLRSALLMIGMAMILFSSTTPQHYLLSIPGSVLYWAANADALATEILLFSLVSKGKKGDVTDSSSSAS